MKKLILPVLMSALFLSSCQAIEVASMSREDEEEPSSLITSYYSGESSVQEKNHISDLSENEYNLIPSKFVEKLKSCSSYKAVTVGQTDASVLFITVPQAINVTVIKGEYSYQYNSSESSMYSSEHNAYYHNNKAVYKDKNDENYITAEMNDYLDKYGTHPFSNSIEGYKYTNDAIVKIKKLKNDDDGNYRFTLYFDPVKATTNVRIQMKEFGNLTDYPEFKDNIQITLTLKDDFTPVNLELESRYKAAQSIGTASCHQKYTVTYSNFNENIEVPHLDTIIPLFGK